MGPFLFFLFYILHLQASIRSEIIETPNTNLNAISEGEDDDFNGNEFTESHPTTTTQPLDLKTGRDQTEMEFRYPVVSLNIDYAKNLIVLKFRKSKMNDEEEAQRRKSLDDNFMRFGRSDPTDFMRFGRSSTDFMRFGKRAFEQLPKVNSLDYQYVYDKDGDTGRRFERSQEGIRDSRGDNFMRFGRPSEDFMRFGKGSPDFMRFGRGNSDDFMRLGRDPKNNFMRFGRMAKEIRDTSKDFMRFGRPDNFMRFGRTSTQPKETTNFIPFEKLDRDFIRFEKSLNNEMQASSTKPPLPKEVIKEAAKILHHAEQFKGEGESNPIDRAFKVLFGKQEHQKKLDHNDKAERYTDYRLNEA